MTEADEDDAMNRFTEAESAVADAARELVASVLDTEVKFIPRASILYHDLELAAVEVSMAEEELDRFSGR